MHLVMMDIDFIVTLLGGLLGNKGAGPMQSWRAMLVPRARRPVPIWPPERLGDVQRHCGLSQRGGGGEWEGQLASGVWRPGTLLNTSQCTGQAYTQFHIPEWCQEGRGGQSCLKGLAYRTHGLL